MAGMQSALEATLQALRLRGCIADATPGLASGIHRALAASAIANAHHPSVYAGFDPTAPSLHLGHAAVMVMLARMQQAGLKPIALIGGATALIGDPTGKREDRPLLSEEAVAANIEGIRRSLATVLDFDASSAGTSSNKVSATLVDNASFYANMPVLGFLRHVGRHFRMNQMLNKDSVRSRLGLDRDSSGAGTASSGSSSSSTETSEGGTSQTAASTGMSYTEFSYQMFQAYDYYILHKQHNCMLQVGGSDQWGNITAGIDLIRRMEGADEATNGSAADTRADVHGLTTPLLTTADGKKFGKSEGNAVWINSDMTSHHSLYQYLLRSEDADVGRLLRLLTLLPDEQIAATLSQHTTKPEAMTAQLLLADTLTGMLRGQSAVASARRSAQLLYGGTGIWSIPTPLAAHTSSIQAPSSSATGSSYLPQRAMLPLISVDDILALSSGGEVPSVTLPSSQVSGASVIDVAVAVGVAKSKSEARRLIESGGLYWNWERVGPKETAWADTASDPAAPGKSGGGALALRRVHLDADFITGSSAASSPVAVAILSSGKKKMYILQVTQ